jgi:hypothetical protein
MLSGSPKQWKFLPARNMPETTCIVDKYLFTISYLEIFNKSVLNFYPMGRYYL